MKIILTAINAKFIHTSLSVRYLSNYCNERLDNKTSFVEFTINHRSDYILEELYRLKPDILCFSVYIWNVDIVLELCENYKKVSPNTKIILGGPEVSYNSEEILSQCDFIDYIISGEGEKSLYELLSTIEKNNNYSTSSITSTSNITIELDELAFPYPDIEFLHNRIFYYESSRGCPFNCQYCLSSSTKGVRFRSLPLVFADLKRFLEAKVSQVKFVDRTFNCNKSHAMAIWQYLIEHDNGKTNFHFEIAADLIDSDCIALLKNAREGLFQFEIGVQSTNPKTLEAIDRRTDLDKLFNVVRDIHMLQSTHQHLDLIAGLPFEDIHMFQKSFDDVFALMPEQLQLGFLKILKGSGLYHDSKKYGLIYRSNAPFEILSTPWLSYEEMLQLKALEEMLELYYNSCRYSNLLELIMKDEPSPFQFFLCLGKYYHANGHHHSTHSKEDYYTILRNFYLGEHNSNNNESLIFACRLDIMTHEKPRKFPEWAELQSNPDARQITLDFLSNEKNVKEHFPSYVGLDPKFIIKQIHFELVIIGEKSELWLFDYQNRDILGRAKKIIIDM